MLCRPSAKTYPEINLDYTRCKIIGRITTFKPRTSLKLKKFPVNLPVAAIFWSYHSSRNRRVAAAANVSPMKCVNQTRTNVINRLRIHEDLRAFLDSDVRS
jgi:hypothetical protein